MNLSSIARKILSEDSWGTNPSAAGSMSPGRAPTATSPSPEQSGNTIDISQSFRNFKLELERQEDASVKKFTNELKGKFLKKTVTVKASKGSVGQIEKDYKILVNNIEVRYMKDKHYVVFVGKEGNAGESEYYLDDSLIEVNPVTTDSSQDSSQSSLRNVGGIVPLKPTSDGSSVSRNIVPQG